MKVQLVNDALFDEHPETEMIKQEPMWHTGHDNHVYIRYPQSTFKVMS